MTYPSSAYLPKLRAYAGKSDLFPNPFLTISLLVDERRLFWADISEFELVVYLN